MLKASFHLHTSSDPRDLLNYSNFQAIDKAAELKFDLISITCHNKVVFSEKLKNYAAERNILLIPGIEKSIQYRHVLILNADEDAESIKTFDQLRALKKEKNWLTIAAHPFFPPISFWSYDTITNMGVFDALEYSYFYSKTINFNKKAKIFAQRFNKALIGTSDIHLLKHFQPTYTLINAEKNIESIFKAIRENKVQLVTKPFRTYQLPLIFSQMIATTAIGKLRKSLKIETNIIASTNSVIASAALSLRAQRSNPAVVQLNNGIASARHSEPRNDIFEQPRNDK